MSNVIKSYTVHLREEDKKTIDCHLRRDSDIQAKRCSRILTTENGSGFVEGLQAVAVDALLSEEELAEKSIKILEDSKKESKSMLDKARLEVEQIKAEALAEAKKKGYEEGMQQGILEIQKELAEIEADKKRRQAEYDTMIAEMEPSMVEIIATLIEKITGILVEDKREVIFYLVEKAITKMDKAEEFKIRVSKEDYSYLTSRKEDLVFATGRDIRISIEEDPELTRQQCLIETDLRILDCSLDVQLTNLVADLKLLGNA